MRLGIQAVKAMPRAQHQSILDGLDALIRQAVRDEVRAALAEYSKTQERAAAIRAERISLRIEDAVEVSGLGETALREAIRAGQLPARKRGRSTLILESDLRRYLDGLPLVPRLSLVS